MDNILDYLLAQIKALKPSFMSKTPHFNFISAHYLLIIGLTILGSVLMFAASRGQLAYIDSLVFAAGANTQAGLNTIDINKLNTFQQVCLYLLAMTCNPMTINSFVVFLRLYWFEKRFQHVVRDARLRRGTISKSKSKVKQDSNQLERGVDGRHIMVMHNGQPVRLTNDGILLDSSSEKAPDKRTTGADAAQDGEIHLGTVVPDPRAGDRREIKFTDAAKRSDAVENGTPNLPTPRSDEEHIAILERQRKRDDEVLRIPGPRDAERGMRPERVHEADMEEPEPTSPVTRHFSTDSDPIAAPRNPDGRHQAITIEEPNRRMMEESPSDDIVDDARAFANVFSPLRFRKPRMFNKKEQKLHQEDNAFHITSPKARRRQTFETLKTAFSREKEEEIPYLSWTPTLGRNSAFPGLTEEQREELGGIEYRSLKTLALILTCYFWGFSIFGVACMLPWILNSGTYGSIVDNADQSRVWWGFFTPHSAFMDLGFTLTSDSMNSFNTGIFPLLLMSFLIVIGNTGFPVMLRFIIWCASLVVPRGTGLYEELRFLLDHPRRCFTLLFPSGATWWLFWLLVVLNGLDLIFFIVLDLGNGPVVELPPGIRVLDGWFQATSTRTAGFSCVNLADLHPAVQVSYMIMMYISVFPIAISVRRTNVYEEKSLGVYVKHEEEEPSAANDLSYVGAHLRRQLSFDLWYIFVGLFILAISEGPRLASGDIAMFAVLFEIVSAYGTVGLSLGYPTVNASLCSQFSVVGKLVVVAMMIRGRHRGLPYGLDRAILLPGDSLNRKEAADADTRTVAANPRGSAVSDANANANAAATGAVARPASLVTARQRSGSRSRSVDHANVNLLTQFLHPGPVLQRGEAVFPSARRKSVTDPGTNDDGVDPHRPRPGRSDSHPIGQFSRDGVFQHQ